MKDEELRYRSGCGCFSRLAGGEVQGPGGPEETPMYSEIIVVKKRSYRVGR